MEALFEVLGGPENALLVFGSATMLALVGIIAYFVVGDDRRADRSLHRNLQAVQGRWGSGVQAAKAASLRLRSEESGLASFDKIVRQLLPQRQALVDRLARTGRQITVTHYVLACVFVGLGTIILLNFTTNMPGAFNVLIGIAAGFLLPHGYVGGLAKRRIKTFLTNFPEAIELMVRTVRSGLPITEGIGIVGQEMPGAIGDEFGQVEQSIKIGRTLDEAMWDAAKRLDCPEFKFFVISLSVQRETGGNLAETLENLADILRRRRQMVLKVKALSSEARASAMIIGSLPFLMFAILMALNSEYMGQMLTDPRGQIMLGVGLTSITMGILFMAKLIRFEI